MRLQNDDVQDFDTRSLAASEYLRKWSWKVFFLSKLRDSVQLQTALTLYEQENDRNNEHPNCSSLQTSARRHIDQTVRTASEPGTKQWKEEK